MAKSWKFLIKRPLTKSEKKSFVSAVAESTQDRSVALILGAFVEQALEEAIKSRLTPMGKRDSDELFESGPLRSIESKIKMAKALGILNGKWSARLNNSNKYAMRSRIRYMRSNLAHLEFGLLV